MQSPHAIYADAFPRENGHAFWLLEPNNRPHDYFVQGVQIGDVLVLTPDGGYDYLFNICRPEAHPVNAGRTYDGFEHLPLNLDLETFDRRDWQSAGSCLGSSGGRMFSANAFASAQGLPVPVGAGLGFSTSRSSGALLSLPDGASRMDLRNHKRFKDWIARNIQAVFEHVNGDQLGREATSIFIVTGCDKSTESVVAASTNASDLHKFWFNLNVASVGVDLTYSSSFQCPSSMRATPITYNDEGIKNMNHCSFARGLTCTKRRHSNRLRITIKVGDLSADQSWDVEDKNVGRSFWSFFSFRSRLSRSSGQQPSGSSPSSSTWPSTRSTPTSFSQDLSSRPPPHPEPGDSDDERNSQYQSNDDGEIHLSFPRYSGRDPWAEMNERFLMLHPDYDYVISHTNDLPQAPEQIPPYDDHDVSLAVDEVHPEHSSNHALASHVIDAPSEETRTDEDPSPQAPQLNPVAQSLGDQMPVTLTSYPQGDFEPCKDLTADLTVPPGFAITSGGYSDVYRGHLRTENGGSIEVAVKIFRSTDAQDSERLHKRLRHEAKILNAAAHPLIVKFYGTAVFYTRPALVLKWYHNGNASRYLAGRTTTEKLLVIKDIAIALEHLHSQNIVHGELKGANVLITDTGNAVLTDFGLSHVIDKQTNATTTSNACSVRWLSPELAAILLAADGVSLTVRNRRKESDVWAFGSTVFELLSGTVPYGEIKNTFSIFKKIFDGLNPLEASPSTVLEPSTIIPIVQQCWRVQPADRPNMSDIVRMLSML